MSTNVATRRLIFELAGPADDQELRQLLRDTPMGGTIEVAFLREPNFFHATAIQGTSTQVLVGRQNGRIVVVGTRALRSTYINGRLVTAGYLGDLRLRPEHRGGTVIARGYRFLESLHQDGRAEIYSSVIVADNRLAFDTIAANRAGLPRYTDLGLIRTPMIYLRRRKTAIPSDVIRGRPELLPAIVAKLNENRGQFAPAWTESDFLDGRLRGFRLEDFYVLRRGSRIAGVLGTWDQGSFRQTVAMRYHGVLGTFRPFINLVRRPPLPAPGHALKFFYVAFIATDDVDAFRTLLRHVYNNAVGGPYSHFVVGLHERDPRVNVLEEYAHMPFAGRLFAVTFGTSPQMDDRVPYVEASLL